MNFQYEKLQEKIKFHQDHNNYWYFHDMKSNYKDGCIC